ncbi:MAG: aldose 1-epimerase family protein [Pirellulales bacterium]|nr:aldose 1-epimerase family protein [Pirellulales bacterium]
MTRQSWVLCDTSRAVYTAELQLTGKDLAALAPGSSIHKRTLRGGLCDGVDVVEIDNGVFRFTVLPTRGMGLWRAALGDFELGWRAPVPGPVNPRNVNLWEPSGLGWLRGFDEVFCRCGLESNGGPVFDSQGRLRYPLHGRISNTPAWKLELAIDDGEISLTGVVDEACLYHSKLRLTSTVRTRVGESGLRIEDTVQNVSAEPGQMELLYHTNFGRPLVEPGAEIVAPAKTVVPWTARAAEGVDHWNSYGPEEPGFTEQVYFLDLAAGAGGETEVLLRDARARHGVSLHFSKRAFPYFTLWKSTQAVADGYVTGLEPGVNLPNERLFEEEQQRVVNLAGGESRTFHLRLEAHGDTSGVAAAATRIAALVRGAAPRVLPRPERPWAPV